MYAHSVGGLSAEASKLYRVRKTCLKMLSKRGYIVPDEHIQMSTDAFMEKFGVEPSRDALSILVENVDDSMDQLFVFFPTVCRRLTQCSYLEDDIATKYRNMLKYLDATT